jgi:CHASE2 domain-containing sensor protein
LHIVYDPIYVVNLVLCAIILVFGLIGWRRSKRVFPIYIGIAFGLFGLSHLVTILGLKATPEVPLIVVRTLAYLIVVFTVYKMAFGSR